MLHTSSTTLTFSPPTEMDIYEGVNLQAANQYSLHTLQGCQHPATINTAAESGTLSQYVVYPPL